MPAGLLDLLALTGVRPLSSPPTIVLELTAPGLEYRAPAEPIHYRAPGAPLHYRAPTDQTEA